MENFINSSRKKWNISFLLMIIFFFNSTLIFSESEIEDYDQTILIEAMKAHDTSKVIQIISDDEIYYNKKGSEIHAMNPLTLAFENKCYEYFKIIISIRPELLTRVFERGYMGGEVSPTIFKVVESNDIVAAKMIIDLGYPINWIMDHTLILPQNLLSVAKSKEMIDYLKKIGVRDTITINNWEIIANDNNINIRDRPGKDGRIIGKVMKGEKGIVTKYYTIKEKIETKDNYWVYIKYPNKEGWSYLEYFIIPNLVSGE